MDHVVYQGRMSLLWSRARFQFLRFVIFQYERRKELPVKVRKERKPRASKTPNKDPGKKRKLSKTPAKKPKKKRRRYVINSDSEFSEQDDSDEDYDGT